MQVEVVDLVKAAFNNSSYGVNAKLLTIVTGSGDLIPPQIVTVESELDNNNAAMMLTPEFDMQVPAIQIFLPHQNIVVSSDVVSGTQDADVAVLARLVYKRSDSAAALRSFLYTIRAMKMCMNSFINDANEADRELRNVQIVLFAKDLEIVETGAYIGDNWITGGLLMTFKVRDITP
jgi:hypothetical protein